MLEKSPGPFSVFAWYKYSSTSVSGIFFVSKVQCDPSKIKKKKVENLIKRISLNQSELAVFYLSSSTANCVKQNSNFE